MNRHDDDELTAAEQRLRVHLALLRPDAPRAPGLIVPRVVRSARWQRAIRRPLAAIRAPPAIVRRALRLLLKPPPATHDIPSASILGPAGQQLGSFLPRLGGALALLIIGLLLVRVLCRLLVKVLLRLGVDDLAPVAYAKS